MGRLVYVWIMLAVVGILLGLRCGSDKVSTPTITTHVVIPDSLVLEVSSSQQFAVDFDGETPEARWYVDGVLGGTPEKGMITPEGLYVAPPEIPQAGFAIVKAKAIGDPLLQGTAKVVVSKTEETSYVVLSPDVVTVAVSDSIRFSTDVFGCGAEDIVWSVELLDGICSEKGVVRGNGTYVAPSAWTCEIELMVMAQSQTCTDKTGVARVLVRAPTAFFVQTEDYADSSGVGILRGVSCGGGVGVNGLDSPGEWIEIPIDVALSGTYMGEISYAAGDKDVLELTLSAEGCGPGGTSPEVSFTLDMGSGVGG